MAWFDFLSPITNIIKDPIVEWQKRKTVKTQAKAEIDKILANAEVAKANAQLEMAKQGQAIQADWDSKALDQAAKSWKDEILMCILFIPVVSNFYGALFDPEILPRVERAMEALDKIPLYYQIILWGVIAYVFGLRWLIQPLVSKVGNPFKK